MGGLYILSEDTLLPILTYVFVNGSNTKLAYVRIAMERFTSERRAFSLQTSSMKQVSAVLTSLKMSPLPITLSQSRLFKGQAGIFGK